MAARCGEEERCSGPVDTATMRSPGLEPERRATLSSVRQLTGRGRVKRIVLVAAAVTAVASSTAGAAPLVKGPAYTWGLNTHGQLGLGYSSNDLNTPTKVVSLGQVRGVAAGQRHTLAARKDGTIWAFGDNAAGQLGNGTTDPAYSPVQVTGLAHATAVAAGWDHSPALRAGGGGW